MAAFELRARARSARELEDLTNGPPSTPPRMASWARLYGCLCVSDAGRPVAEMVPRSVLRDVLTSRLRGQVSRLRFFPRSLAPVANEPPTRCEVKNVGAPSDSYWTPISPPPPQTICPAHAAIFVSDRSLELLGRLYPHETSVLLIQLS